MRISDWSSDVCSSDLDEQCRNRSFHLELLVMAVKPLLSDAARATMRKATSIFFTGLLAVLPILVTMSLVMWLIGAAESVLGGMLSILLPGDAYRRGMGLDRKSTRLNSSH